MRSVEKHYSGVRSGKERIVMTGFEHYRLNQYIDGAQDKLLAIRQILRNPLTANQAAAFWDHTPSVRFSAYANKTA